MSRLNAISDWTEKARLARYNANQMARLCLVSPSQLRRYFAVVFGKSPQSWLNELRLWQAAQLVCSGTPVKEITYQLHFANEAHLCHQFKRYHGCSPLEFVLRNRQPHSEQIDPMGTSSVENVGGLATPRPASKAPESDLCKKKRLLSVPER